jgi:GTP1/Obg family GTP-binding protein
MAEKDLIVKEKMSHNGIFDFEGFYSFCHGWFDEENYGVVEERYDEKVAGNKKNIFYQWKANKKLSDYFKIEQDIKFFVNDLTDVEVEIDGTKKKMNKGNIAIEIKGALVKDYKSKWDVSPLNKFLRDVYNKFIVSGRVDALEGKTEEDAQTFKEEVKAYLELSGKR